MGFKDAEWAYSLTLPMREKVILAAVALRTDDKSHETIVGHQTIAEMTGASVDTVRRSLGVLELQGLIARTRRHGAGGYRTSDLTTLKTTTYHADGLQGQEPTRPAAYKADSGDLTSSQPSPTRLTAGAEEIIQIDHSEDHSDSPPNEPEGAFHRAYEHWPKKTEKKASLSAFKRAAKARPTNQLEADVIRFGDAYAATTDRRFVPSLAAWLNGERWNDDPPESKPTVPATLDTASLDAAWAAALADHGREKPAVGPCGHEMVTDRHCALGCTATGIAS